MKTGFNNRAGIHKVLKNATIGAGSVVILAGALTAGFVMLPGLESDTLDDFMSKTNSGTIPAGYVDHKNIRVYDTADFLTYARFAINLGYDQMAMNGRDKLTAAKIKAVAITSVAEAKKRAKDRGNENRVEGFALRAPDRDGACYILRPGLKVSRQTMIEYFTGIRPAHMRDFTGNDLTLAYIMRHEAKHCEDPPLAHPANVVVLQQETKSDLAATADLAAMPGGEEENRIVRYSRAISAATNFDSIHATALALDVQEHGGELPDADDVLAINNGLEYLAAIEGAGSYTGEERTLYIYHRLKFHLADGTFDGDPGMRRAAELYVEAVEYLAPKAPGVTPAAAQAAILTLQPAA